MVKWAIDDCFSRLVFLIRAYKTYKKWNYVCVTMNADIFCHSWGYLAKIFTRDFATHENHCHLWQKIGIHGSPYIILHIMQGCCLGSNEIVSEATMVNTG